MSDRPLRSCDECGQIDDHPRHVFLAGPNEVPVNQAAVDAVGAADLPLADAVRIHNELTDTTILQRHMDCCRAAGCPDGSCNQMPAEQHDLRGHKLVEAITGEKVK